MSGFLVRLPERRAMSEGAVSPYLRRPPRSREEADREISIARARRRLRHLKIDPGNPAVKLLKPLPIPEPRP